MRGFGRQDDLDRILHSAYGEPQRALVDRLSGLVPARRHGVARRSLAVAVAFSAVTLTALAAVGGVGYAASTIAGVAHQVAHPASLFGARMALVPAQHSAAADEYTQSDSASTQSLPSSSETPPDETTAFKAGGSGGVPPVSVDVPSNALNQIVSAATTGSGGGGSLPAQIHIDPAPPSQSTAAAAVGIVVTDTNGKVVKVSLDTDKAPVDVALDAVWSTTSGTAPCIDSNDGRGCVAAPFVGNGTEASPTAGYSGHAKCSDFGATPPAGTPDTRDGWYIDSSSKYHILTCHLTIFAIISKADLKVSKTGRPLAPANSGKFGDAALYSTADAQLKQVGSAKTSTLKSGGAAVSFKFFVDQQVSAYIQLYKGGKKLPIALKGTMIRGTTLKKSGHVPTLHVAVLRPGTLGVRLNTAGLRHGASYRIRIAVLNFDGSKTVAFIPFKG